jgi:hypothetical protein
MIRQTPTRRLKVLVTAVAGAGMLATAALAATSTAPRGSYGGLPVSGGYGGYGGYGFSADDDSAVDGGQDDGPSEKGKKSKKDKQRKQQDKNER